MSALLDHVSSVALWRAAPAGRWHVRSAAVPVWTAATVIVAGVALFASVGADARWLAALGRAIAHGHGVSAGVPFAAAPSSHFPNVLALAELIFYGLERTLGDRGLMLAQLAAVTIALAVLGKDALAGGARHGGVATALGIAAIGALPSLAIVRVQLFSLALFPVLVALLRREARQPSRRLWLAVPLLALWSNLHGAVLVGFGVLCCYLALSRFRIEPWVAVGVAVAGAVALGLTPALAGSYDYYHRTLTNVALQRAIGYWAPLTLTHVFDVVLVLAALTLARGLRRARPPVWELFATGALAVATVLASRDGVWLIFFLVPTGACAMRFKPAWGRIALPLLTAALLGIALAIVTGPAQSGASRGTIARALALAHGTPILAPDIIAEQIALAGGRVWLSNPLEEFSRRDQATYLDWSQGLRSGRRVLAPSAGIHVVLVDRGSATERLVRQTPNFSPTFTQGNTVIYVRAVAGA